MRKFTHRERARRILSSIVAGLAMTAVISTSRVCFASQIDAEAKVQPAAAAAPWGFVRPDREIAEGIVLQVLEDFPVTLPGNPIADETRPNPAESEVRRKPLEKLRQPSNAPINNVSVADVLDTVATEHDFHCRCDLEGVERAKTDPEQTRAGGNVRRREVAGALREILGPHNLRFAVDDGEDPITNRAPQPGGVKRKKTDETYAIEQVVLGKIDVRDKNDEAEAKEAAQATSRAVVQLDQPVIKDKAQQEMKDRERAYFRKQFQMALRTELALTLRACRPNPEQQTEIRKAAEKAFEETLEKMVDIQVQMKRGWNGPPPKYLSLKEEVQQAITATVNRLLPVDAAATHKKEVDARIEHRKTATIRNLVSMVDRNVILSAEQRRKLTAQMAKHWSPTWGNALEYMQWGDNVFPNMPAECLDSVLNDNQKRVWAGVHTVERSEFWGVRFGFLNAQLLLDGEDVGEDVGEAVQLNRDDQAGVSVEGALALPAAGKAESSDAKPAAENVAEEKPVPEKPVPEKHGDG